MRTLIAPGWIALLAVAACGSTATPTPAPVGPTQAAWTADDSLLPATVHLPAPGTFDMSGARGTTPDHAHVTVAVTGNAVKFTRDYGTAITVDDYRMEANGFHLVQSVETLTGGGSFTCMAVGDPVLVPIRLDKSVNFTDTLTCDEVRRGVTIKVTIAETEKVIGATHESFGGTSVAVVKTEVTQVVSAGGKAQQTVKSVDSYDAARGLTLDHFGTVSAGGTVTTENLVATSLPPVP